MFNIFSRKRSLLLSDFFKGLSDFHSHILPSVDDGVRGVNNALQILAEYEHLGVKRVVFTPHVMEAFSKNNTEYLRSEFEKFNSLYNGNIEISLAAEYMLDNLFDEHLQSNNMLTLRDKYLLVETSYMFPPMNFEQTLKRISAKGYYVVLAHPERYGYMHVSELKQLKDNGVLFQLNILSLSGYYGGSVKDRAIYLLENGMYNLIGSDIHNLEVFQEWVRQIKLKPKQIQILEDLRDNAII